MSSSFSFPFLAFLLWMSSSDTSDINALMQRSFLNAFALIYHILLSYFLEKQYSLLSSKSLSTLSAYRYIAVCEYIIIKNNIGVFIEDSRSQSTLHPAAALSVLIHEYSELVNHN